MRSFAAVVATALLAMTLGCSQPDTFKPSEVKAERFSNWDKVQHIFFTVPAGEECAGARTRWEGSSLVLTFVREGDVDLVATRPEENNVGGFLRIEVPIEDLRREGQEMSVVFEGRGERQEMGTFSFAPLEDDE